MPPPPKKKKEKKKEKEKDNNMCGESPGGKVLSTVRGCLWSQYNFGHEKGEFPKRGGCSGRWSAPTGRPFSTEHWLCNWVLGCLLLSAYSPGL